MRPDNHAPLAAAAARRHEHTRSRAIKALHELDRAGAAVTFAAVAAAAGFSELEMTLEFAVRRPGAGGMQDRGDHQVDVAMIEPSNRVAQVNRDTCGEAGGDAQDPVFALSRVVRRR
jgi:hypothetical protein